MSMFGSDPGTETGSGTGWVPPPSRLGWSGESPPNMAPDVSVCTTDRILCHVVISVFSRLRRLRRCVSPSTLSVLINDPGYMGREIRKLRTDNTSSIVNFRFFSGHVSEVTDCS